MRVHHVIHFTFQSQGYQSSPVKIGMNLSLSLSLSMILCLSLSVTGIFHRVGIKISKVSGENNFSPIT